MIKKLLGATFVAILMAGTPAIAQNTSDETAKTEKTSKCDKKQKHDKKRHCKHGDKICSKKRAERKDEFAGMTLSETQQQKLSELKQKEQVKKEEFRKEAKAQRQKMKDERRSARKAYLEEVKVIVGEENFEIYKKNNKFDSDKRSKKDGKHRGDKRVHAKMKNHRDNDSKAIGNNPQ